MTEPTIKEMPDTECPAHETGRVGLQQEFCSGELGILDMLMERIDKLNAKMPPCCHGQ